MYYYYRVAEELVFVVFVLPSRCANSLKRTPLPPSPPKKKITQACPRPFLSVGWKKEHGLQEEIKLNLKEMKFSTVKLAVLLILNLTGFPK